MIYRLLFSIACIASFAALLLVPNDEFGTHSETRAAPQNITYDARDQKGSKAEYRVDDGNPKSVHLAFRFMAYKERGYQDLFQTAGLNRGMRLELAPDRTLALLIAARNPQTFDTFILTNDIEVNQWHHVSIDVSYDSRVAVRLDGATVATAHDPQLSYRVSHILFGGGFSPARRFDGRIENGSLTYGILVRDPISPQTALLLRSMLLLAGLACFYFATRSSRARPTDEATA